ncbi:TfoX/Sxy family DNA transformation protein [Poseidonocella sp. HB161398]|uniref:TfoX/Sxy family DNA transformation protein n=1 Tax=Poseidonocella sp. HB161398 TaxID=2320855 RepID=UPI0011080E3B|nr:TfoX/Sxy family DNA transformation protein [Poseidonocella sp. HB161398]
MSTPISALRNMGPAMEAAFAAVGIGSAEALRELGVDAAYARLLANGARPHFIGYYIIEMSLQGRPWNDCKGAEKDALRKRFDRIKAAAVPTDRGALRALDRILDEIGVIPKRG